MHQQSKPSLFTKPKFTQSQYTSEVYTMFIRSYEIRLGVPQKCTEIGQTSVLYKERQFFVIVLEEGMVSQGMAWVWGPQSSIWDKFQLSVQTEFTQPSILQKGKSDPILQCIKIV